MKKIFWQFSTYEIKKDLILFNRIIIGSHFEGVKSYSIEFYFDGGTIGFSSFWKKWTVGNDFSDKIQHKGKLTGICLRFGSPIVNIWFSKRMAKKALEAVKRYEITY